MAWYFVPRVRYIVEREGQQDLVHMRRWPPFRDVPAVGSNVRIPDLLISGTVIKVVKVGAMLHEVFVRPD